MPSQVPYTPVDQHATLVHWAAQVLAHTSHITLYAKRTQYTHTIKHIHTQSQLGCARCSPPYTLLSVAYCTPHTAHRSLNHLNFNYKCSGTLVADSPDIEAGNLLYRKQRVAMQTTMHLPCTYHTAYAMQNIRMQ